MYHDKSIAASCNLCTNFHFCQKSEIDTFIRLHSKDKVNFIQSNFNALQWQGWIDSLVVAQSTMAYQELMSKHDLLGGRYSVPSTSPPSPPPAARTSPGRTSADLHHHRQKERDQNLWQQMLCFQRTIGFIPSPDSPHKDGNEQPKTRVPQEETPEQLLSSKNHLLTD